MAIKIHSTKDVTSDGCNMVIYGNSGVGKTYLIKHLDNAIILSAEKGLLTLKDEDIDYIKIANMDDVQEAYDTVRKSKYDHIVFDSLTEISEVVLFDIKAKLKAEGKGKDVRQAYGVIADSFGIMIRKFRDIDGKNTIFMAKEKNIYDEDDFIIGYSPMMPGKVLPHGLPYLVDEVLSYQMDRKGDRFFLTSATRKYPAKDRSGALDAKELNPNLNDIINRVLATQKEKKNG